MWYFKHSDKMWLIIRIWISQLIEKNKSPVFSRNSTNVLLFTNVLTDHPLYLSGAERILREAVNRFWVEAYGVQNRSIDKTTL